MWKEWEKLLLFASNMIDLPGKSKKINWKTIKQWRYSVRCVAAKSTS